MSTLAKLVWIEVKLFAREPVAVVFAFAFPLVVLLVLAGVFGSEPDSSFGGVAGIDYYVPGYLAVVIASIGLIGLPVHLASLRERGVLRRLRASSVSMTGVFGAQTVVHLAMAVLGGALLLVAAGLVYDVHARRRSPVWRSGSVWAPSASSPWACCWEAWPRPRAPRRESAWCCSSRCGCCPGRVLLER
jgi:ABC-type transport system involved in cytochrome c biogenesis permease component